VNVPDARLLLPLANEASPPTQSVKTPDAPPGKLPPNEARPPIQFVKVPAAIAAPPNEKSPPEQFSTLSKSKRVATVKFLSNTSTPFTNTSFAVIEIELLQ